MTDIKETTTKPESLRTLMRDSKGYMLDYRAALVVGWTVRMARTGRSALARKGK